MKILVFIEHLGLGGVVRQVSILADHLERRGHDVSLLALYTLDQDWNLVSKRNYDTLAQKPRGLVSAGIQFTKATLALRRLLKKTNVDILYGFQGHNARFIAWLAARGISNTQLVWGFQGAGRQNTSRARDWKVVLPSHLGKLVSGSIPLMISNSEAGLIRRNTDGYRCSKRLVINNGFDTDQFKPDPEARIRLRSEWKIKNEALIGIVGRLFVSKGHRIFLEAAALLREERTDVRFVIVGDGPDKREIELLSHELGLTESVILLGARQDMPAVYNALDILCSSSYSEGLPNVIGEAMACGVPCVVTDVGDSAKVVGDEGLVVPAGDPQLLAKALKTMLMKLNDIKPLEIRARIVRHFTLENLIDATETALNQIHQVTHNLNDEFRVQP
jgi:glycosyltransferase involved in cell wall biosynthesis